MHLREAAVGCVVLTSLVALLSERTEGHITFFSPKEMMLMKEKEGKKDMEPRSEDGQFDDIGLQQVGDGNPDKTLEIAVHLSPKHLDRMAPALEDFIHEIAEEN